MLSNLRVFFSRSVTTSGRSGVNGVPTSTPASCRISASVVSTLPWTRISVTVSCASVASSLSWTSEIASSSASMSPLLGGARDEHLRRDVGFAVVVVAGGLAKAELADRNRERGLQLDVLGQPDLGKRLVHRHRRLDRVDRDDPGRGQELEVDVVEGVLHNLMGGRLDPQRHERDLVHQPAEVLFLLAVLRALVFRVP